MPGASPLAPAPPLEEQEEGEAADALGLLAGTGPRPGAAALGGPWARRRLRATAAGVAGLSALGALGAIRAAAAGASLAAGPLEATRLQLEGRDPCRGYPYLALDQVLHSNLGNRGPYSGAEGLVYRGRDTGPGESRREILLVINATTPYSPFSALDIGFSGKYASINVQGGTSVRMKFGVLDAQTRKPLALRRAGLTFFDLDMALNGETREYVKAWDFARAIRTQTSELRESVNGDGSTTFSAGAVGTGADGPADPLSLTLQQKNRAVTLEFENATGFELEVGCSAGGHPRYFTFLARPLLRCAQLAEVGLPDPGLDDDANPATSTSTSTTATATSSTATATTTTSSSSTARQCWFINCIPKLSFS